MTDASTPEEEALSPEELEQTAGGTADGSPITLGPLCQTTKIPKICPND